MNLNLNYGEDFKDYLVKKRECEILEGVQYVFGFDNDFGASVIKNKYSYGHEKELWELAVLTYNHEENYYEENYTNPISNDVIGYLTNDDVIYLLKQIKEL